MTIKVSLFGVINTDEICHPSITDIYVVGSYVCVAINCQSFVDNKLTELEKNGGFVSVLVEVEDGVVLLGLLTMQKESVEWEKKYLLRIVTLLERPILLQKHLV